MKLLAFLLRNRRRGFISVAIPWLPIILIVVVVVVVWIALVIISAIMSIVEHQQKKPDGIASPPALMAPAEWPADPAGEENDPALD